MVESLGQQIETLQAVQSGTIPPVPEFSSMVMPVPEPSVSVVEVSALVSFNVLVFPFRKLKS